MPDKDVLFYKKKNTFDTISEEESARADAYCEEYKHYLDNAKTERESVTEAIRLASGCGFLPYKRGMELKSGVRIYTAVDGKALILAVIGQRPLSDGVNIAAAHIDSPRIDLKQVPLYEDGEMAFFKTHYYGGIKKYQWVTLPLALHGVVIKKDGSAVNIVIGEDENDPVFMITDLLPHLGKDQEKKTLADAFTGENLNILIGSKPTGEEKDDNRVKLTVMSIINEKYGITEDDFMSAEIEAVPQMRARDVGFDRSMIGAYGHDDRSSAFAALRAIMDLTTPQMTAVCVLADKEEIGSDGVSGMQSAMFEDFMEDICDGSGVRLRDCFKSSFCLSADVCNAFDPNFPDVSEKLNAAKLGCGMGISKFGGARGKSGSSDASAEIVAMLRALFEEKGVAWQMAELGKVDQGGGGTVAKFMANRNIATIDAGVAVLSMHAPYEIVSKLDCYMTYKGILAIYEQ
jgi:aspartyl aminopeptidase